VQPIKCISGRVEKAWIVDGKRVCIATHPDSPNFDGKSRGRKIHLAKDMQSTVCNLLVTEFVPERDRNWSCVMNGECIPCFIKSNNKSKGEQMTDQSMDMSKEKRPNIKKLLDEGWNLMTIESCEPSVSKAGNAMMIIELNFKPMDYIEKIYLVAEEGKRWQLKKLLTACDIEAGKDGVYEWNTEDIVGKEIRVLNEPEDSTWINRSGDKVTTKQNRFNDFETMAWDEN